MFDIDPQCTDPLVPPREITYRVMLEVTVADVVSGPVNTDVQFVFEIGNACEMNSLTIANHFPIIYNLRVPPVLYPDKMVVSQTYNFCPFECTLEQLVLATRTWEPYPIEIFNTWNPFKAEFSILTSNKSLNGVVMPMKVTCLSTLSLSQVPVISQFVVRYIDECLSVMVKPPSLEDVLIPLFIDTLVDYPPAQSNYNCGEIVTTLLGVEPGYPEVVHYPEVYQFSVHGTDPERHVDEFPLVFNSCIMLNGAPYGCRNSTTFRVKLTNPCDTSIILSNPLPNSLSAPAMGFDDVNLLDEPTFWPWDEFFSANGEFYVNYCKPFTYEIVYAGTNILVDFVSLDAD